MTHVIAARNFSSSGFRTWQVVEGQLTNLQTYSAMGSAPRGPDLTPDGQWLIYGQSLSPYLVIRSNENGALGSNVEAAVHPDTSVARVRVSPTGQWVAILHETNGTGHWAGNNLSILSFDDGVLEHVTSISLGSGTGLDCAWNAAETRLLVTINNSWAVYLVAFDGQSLTQLASSNLGTSSNTANRKRRAIWLSNTRAAVARQHSFEVVDLSGDSFNVIQDGLIGQWFSRAGDRVIAPRSSTSNGAVAYQFVAGELQEVLTSTDDFFNVSSINDTGDLIAASDADGLNLYSYDGSNIVLLDTGVFALNVTDVLIWPFWQPQQPPEGQELFHLQFADVAGRDPFPSALRTRTDARALAEHNVINYLYNPRFVSKPEEILLGEHHLTRPGGMIWMRDPEDPAFKRWRWAQIMGRDGDSRPGTRTLLLRIADNPKSWEPPPGWTPPDE